MPLVDRLRRGAMVGACLEEWWAMRSLALTVGILILVAKWDLAQPDTPRAGQGVRTPRGAVLRGALPQAS